jgi:hypothetical protein
MIGQSITNYHVVTKLGGGGMGVAYKAEDAKLNVQFRTKAPIVVASCQFAPRGLTLNLSR